MFKFRTMGKNAEKETGPVFTRPDDPRRTKIGTFLRKTSLDELPQLFNVLRGDMSVVGPRPERPVFINSFRILFRTCSNLKFTFLIARGVSQHA